MALFERKKSLLYSIKSTGEEEEVTFRESLKHMCQRGKY